MNAALRKIGALVIKDFFDLLKNPVSAICAIMPIGFMLLYRYGMLSNLDADTATYFVQYLAGTAACMSAGMVGTMLILYTIAEEREKHTLRTLMLANVSAGQVLIAKAIVALAVIAIIDPICYLIVGADPSLLVPFLGIAVVGSLPIVLLSLLCGLFAREQMSAGLYSLPVIILALLPMMGMFNEGLEHVASFSPCGGTFDLIMLLLEGSLLTSQAIEPLMVTIAWTAITALLFFVLYKKVGPDN